MARLRSRSAESSTKTTDSGEVNATDESKTETHSLVFRAARLLFGGVLAFMAVDNFRDLDGTIEYAKSSGAPMPEVLVPFVTGNLLFGGLGITLWRLPTLSAAAVATFFGSITPVMHDFWNVEDDQQREQQMIHFLKNTALFGAALAFMRLGAAERTESDGRVR